MGSAEAADLPWERLLLARLQRARLPLQHRGQNGQRGAGLQGPGRHPQGQSHPGHRAARPDDLRAPLHLLADGARGAAPEPRALPVSQIHVSSSVSRGDPGVAGQPPPQQHPGAPLAPGRCPHPQQRPALPPTRDRHHRAQHLQEAPDLPAERPPFQCPPRETSHRGPDHRILQIPGGAAPGPQPARQDRDRLLALPALAGRRGDRVEEADGVQEGRGGG
ncbi:hypothetical protein RLOC_00009968 [Lonchura striata]|uniref:Uncharacterized protein n=1 Tax=Lonchura striata TaxID=40157 RepID=A0A218UAY5_9PASE|nr:hypothetical protein RLOC_00009968 [Lonchura striata domestica]